MAENTKISWADHTWNPVQGCHKVSAGCKNCYMYRDKKRFGQDASTVIRSSKRTFDLPLRIKEPGTVFTCSWSDFFIEEADEWRDDAWDIIASTQHLTYLILTKRPERLAGRIPNDGLVIDNVWLGITAENQEMFSIRMTSLHDQVLPKFISVEPMIGPVDIEGWQDHINWVICGGETGPNAREMNLDWARSLRDQCKEYQIPFFFKQTTNKGPIPDDLNIQEFPWGK